MGKTFFKKVSSLNVFILIGLSDYAKPVLRGLVPLMHSF